MTSFNNADWSRQHGQGPQSRTRHGRRRFAVMVQASHNAVSVIKRGSEHSTRARSSARMERVNLAGRASRQWRCDQDKRTTRHGGRPQQLGDGPTCTARSSPCPRPYWSKLSAVHVNQ